MNAYELDPLGRGPKGHPPISQPPPPHPNSSADDTSFRPTSDSSPMFPDASFDVSTNKSSAANSRRRPLESPHMAPPPLPPNTPSLYSRSLPPPLPTIVHRDDGWGESQVPPSPMQIMMARQSASASHSREAREPHNDGHYPSPRINKRGGGREERVQPPPTVHDDHYFDSYDKRYHPDSVRDPYAHHEQHTTYGHRRDEIDYYANNRTLHVNSGRNPNQNSNMRINSVETAHHLCNCENCRYREEHNHSSSHHDEGNTCSYNLQTRQDILQQHNNTHHRNYQSTNEYSHHDVNYDPMINYGNSQHSQYEGREPKSSQHYERVGHGTHQQHIYNGERRTPPPQSPLSPITYGWSPKSDNATLHAETFQVPQYGNSNSSNERREYEHHHHHAHHHNEGYTERPVREQTHYDYRTHPYSRDDHHCREKQELNHSGHDQYKKQLHVGHHLDGHIPTHVSYRSEESRPSPDRRDDYSGSTIPTYSTNTPRRSSHSETYRESKPNLSVTIPVSPMDSSKSHHQDRHYQHPPPPNSSRSGYRSAPSSYHVQQPYTSRSEPSQHQKSQTRTAVADREREKSEARHQIMKEIHQATNMRNSALDSNDRRFWDKQIATLNASFKNL
eukprot:scaffold50084_cov67-Cyclotella_meneghiniana.AAC.3